MARVPLPDPEPMKLTRLADIARGGMGSVELARVDDGRLAGQVLAIKRLHTTIADDPQFVSMFLDEAWLTSALQHPNVVEVAALGTDERGLFLAIEFVQGVSLARLLKESKQNQEAFAERTVAHICSQICAGLTAAHDLRGPDGALLGLVHRDLAPANILLRFDGVIKIIDFGIAKAEERITHTRTGQLKGKPAYMAPEQARGRKVDLRADIFSFGVMMFELLAGRRPWTAKIAFDVMMQIMNDPPPDIGALRPGLNPELIAIINKCIEKEPDKRFSSAAEIQAALDGWRAQKGFIEGDVESLASFVVRNSTAQIKWYEAALEGEIARARAPTFKELEEQIDAEREEKDGTRKGRSIRPAAGKPVERIPPLAPAPTPRPPEPTMPPLPDLAPTRPLTLDERLAPPPPRGSSNPPAVKPAPSGERIGIGSGTEYLAASPRATPLPGGDPSAGSPAESRASPAPGRRASPPGALSAPPAAAGKPEFMGGGVFSGPPGLDGGGARPSSAPQLDKLASSSRLIVALVILIVVLTAGAFFVWRKRIMKTFAPDPPPAAAEPSATSPSGGS
jgi:serine/threonine protein kinase